MITCSMSVNLERADGKEGIDGEVMEPPQPTKPKDDNCAKAVAAPSFSSSRRVKFPIGLNLRCALRNKGGTTSTSVNLEMLRLTGRPRANTSSVVRQTFLFPLRPACSIQT